MAEGELERREGQFRTDEPSWPDTRSRVLFCGRSTQAVALSIDQGVHLACGGGSRWQCRGTRIRSSSAQASDYAA